MTTATDIPSPYVIVPDGSPLRADLGQTVEPTTEGLRITAVNCGVNEAHAGPFTWHRTVPADMGGQDTTDNLLDVCVTCETAVQNYLDMARQSGPSALDEQMKAVRRKVGPVNPDWPDAAVADRWMHIHMAQLAFAHAGEQPG